MGREIRRVPASWSHPKENGHFRPLFGGMDVFQMQAEWDEEARRWDEGFRIDYSKPDRSWKPRGADETGTYEEWAGKRPVESDHMPNWPAAERTHFQMYENTTEGTPISPVMESPESLARWLADNGASACGTQTADYDHWLAVCRCGYAPSMVVIGGKVMSGVEAAHVGIG